ncbi:endo-1,4-beta-xylanase [Saliphagus infecundisoli]|uniref:endo-1,4-beta-xylanase n=1 Tax=Saliphagus infecundisoli TaxID=1849069 RepID=A0ABD5QHC6_9EURY|nr:endo-1,4-beta-xylanase [Saliphagus infecundisoli]
MTTRRVFISGVLLGGLVVGSFALVYDFFRSVGSLNEHDSHTDVDDIDPPEDARDERPSNWEANADDRIERHRATSLEVVVVDESGDPVEGATVEVAMQRHAFDFGTAVNAAYLVEESDPGDDYRTAIAELFNTAVLENHHKWGFWEDPSQREFAEIATWWLLEQGLTMRGHTCIWQRRNQGAIPEDVLEAMDDGDGEYVATRSNDHVSSIVGYLSDTTGLTEWDVLNEQVAYHEMTDLIDPDAPPTRSEPILDWYRLAAEADPDARLYLNEYDALVGDDDRHRETLEDIIAYTVENDAPLDGLGMQGHHPSVTHRREPEELLATLDRFGALVDSIKITEYDTWGEEWTEEMEADYLYQFLKTVFSHPSVDGFLMWGFWDAIHWQDNAPLFRTDWSPKPAYDVYIDLVFSQWWTETERTTDDQGRVTISAFLGEYELTARVDGATETTEVAITDPTSETIRLPVD